VSADVRIAADPDVLARSAADWLADELRAARDEARAAGSAAGDGRVSLVLAGGSTPAATYRALALAPVDWGGVALYFGDERCIPPYAPRSNFALVQANLLERLGGGVALGPGERPRVCRVRGEDPDPDAAARDYERELPAVLDVVLLGIGEDGHTASLFPGSAAVAERERRVVATVAPVPPSERITLTPASLVAARRVAVLASGPAKSAAVARALQGPYDPLGCPAQLARGGTWLVDRAAAAGLSTAEAT